MKKKNKFLIGAFITMLLLIITLHIALFAKVEKENLLINKSEINGPINSAQVPQILLLPFGILSGAT